jgi:hypothetical protein
MFDRFFGYVRSDKPLAPSLAITLAIVALAACTSVQSPPAVVTNDVVATTPPSSVSSLSPATIRADGPLPLPKNLVALTDPAGQKRLMQTDRNKSYWPLASHFVTQKNQAYCSVATSVMALNALGIQRPRTSLYQDFPYFTQEDFFSAIGPQLADPTTVSRRGMTLDQLSTVLAQFPVTVQKYRANDLTLDQFRKLVRTTVNSSDAFALLNFKRDSIGQVGGGHWSPLAAFDASSDSALLMDVARYKYPPVWTPIAQLYQAAREIDRESGLARGVLVVGKP